MFTDWHTLLGTFSSIALLALIYPYTQGVLHGSTRPNVVSWVGWCFLFAIATAIQLSKGASWSVVVPLISTISTGIIALLAVRYKHVQFTKLDYFCMLMGLAALGLWLFADQPIVSLLLIIGADFFVTIPTVVKIYHSPKTEPFFLWAVYTIVAGLSIAASTKFDIYNLLDPVYTVLGSAVITLLALRGKIAKDRA